MSDSDGSSTADDADPAAEYVLGLIEGQARRDADARLRVDPAFRAGVEAWERRLAPLLAEVAPVAAPAGVWERIAARIEPAVNVAPPPRRPGLWDRPGVWRIATAASAALAAACLATVSLRPAPPTPVAASRGPILAATVSTEAGKPLFVVTLDASRGDVAVVPVAAVEGRGRHPELWIIAAGGKPRAVGMIAESRSLSLALAGAEPRDVLAVSLEPAGGSPTGAPTGPVIGTGALKTL